MDMAVDPVEPVVAALVELGSKVLLIGLAVIPLEPSRWSSSSGLAYAQAPNGWARLLELALALCPSSSLPDFVSGSGVIRYPAISLAVR